MHTPVQKLLRIELPPGANQAIQSGIRDVFADSVIGAFTVKTLKVSTVGIFKDDRFRWLPHDGRSKGIGFWFYKQDQTWEKYSLIPSNSACLPKLDALLQQSVAAPQGIIVSHAEFLIDWLIKEAERAEGDIAVARSIIEAELECRAKERGLQAQIDVIEAQLHRLRDQKAQLKKVLTASSAKRQKHDRLNWALKYLS